LADVTFVTLASATMFDGKIMPLRHKVKWMEENVTGRDMAIIRKFHQHYRFGLMPATHTCTECGSEVKFEVPVDGSLFLPASGDDFEEIFTDFDEDRDESAGP